MTVIATRTFAYTHTQITSGIPAFCYPLADATFDTKGHYYVSEHDTANQYNTSSIDGAATVDPKKDNQICFGASSTIYTPTAGNSYTLTLYFQSN